MALALDQRHTELGFELGNAAAERRLRAPRAVGTTRVNEPLSARAMKWRSWAMVAVIIEKTDQV